MRYADDCDAKCSDYESCVLPGADTNTPEIIVVSHSRPSLRGRTPWVPARFS